MTKQQALNRELQSFRLTVKGWAFGDAQMIRGRIAAGEAEAAKLTSPEAKIDAECILNAMRKAEREL